MIEAIELDALLQQLVAACAEQMGERAPEFSLHVDARLPRTMYLPRASATAALQALVGWASETGPDGRGAVSLWLPPGDDGAAGRPGILVEGCRLWGDGSVQERPGELERLEAAFAGLSEAPLVHTREGPEERIRLTIGCTPPPEAPAEPARPWGEAFSGRRLLLVRRVLFDHAWLTASLKALGLDVLIEPDPEAALDAARVAAERNLPFDLCAVCQRQIADPGPWIARLRDIPGEGVPRVMAITPLTEAADVQGADAVLARGSGWKRLMNELFILSRDRVSEGATGQTHHHIPSFLNRHILIAEDVSMNQVLMRAMLAPTGATCATASDGAEVLEAMREAPADLILMDIQMPGMDGLEATRRLREAGVICPIIALTANAREADRLHYLSSGMDGYLSKPVKVDDLYAVLTEHLGETLPTAPPGAAEPG